MYDEYTTSNVEAEHSCIKSQSVGLTANAKVTSMFEKTDFNAEKRSHQRIIFQNKDIMCTNVTTKCQISKLYVKKCYEALLNRTLFASNCVSKQTDRNNWVVIYQKPHNVNTKLHLHFLPTIRRKRYVHLTSGESSILILI